MELEIPVTHRKVILKIKNDLVIKKKQMRKNDIQTSTGHGSNLCEFLP